MISQSTAETSSPCTIYQIAASQFQRFVFGDERMSLAVHRCQASELHEHEIRAGVFASCSARERLEWVLTRLVRAEHSISDQQAARLLLPVRGAELAQAIGVAAESLSRLIAELERDGVIRRDRGWLVLLQPDVLAQKWTIASADLN